MTFELATVAAELAGLVIADVRVNDLPDVRSAIDPRLCPVFQMYPQAGIEIAPVVDDSFGSRVAKKHMSYNITYGLFFEPVGVGRGLHEVIQPMVEAASRVITAITNNDALTGTIDIRVTGGSLAGTIKDAADNDYHGMLIRLTVTEFIN